jgi:hypothetical protein
MVLSSNHTDTTFVAMRIDKISQQKHTYIILKASSVKLNRMPAYGVFHPCLKAVELGLPAAQPAWSAPTRPGRYTETWGPGPSSARPRLDIPAERN